MNRLYLLNLAHYSYKVSGNEYNGYKIEPNLEDKILAQKIIKAKTTDEAISKARSELVAQLAEKKNRIVIFEYLKEI